MKLQFLLDLIENYADLSSVNVPSASVFIVVTYGCVHLLVTFLYMSWFVSDILFLKRCLNFIRHLSLLTTSPPLVCHITCL